MQYGEIKTPTTEDLYKLHYEQYGHIIGQYGEISSTPATVAVESEEALRRRKSDDDYDEQRRQNELRNSTMDIAANNTNTTNDMINTFFATGIF